MMQVLTTTMAATLKASAKGLEIVDKARCRRGWAKASHEWADLAITSRATLRRFWARAAINSETFKSVCNVVGIDWKDVVESNPPKKACLEDRDSSKQPKKRLIFELEADFESLDPEKLHAVMTQLSQMGNPVMRLVDIEEGSINFMFEGSQEDLERIENLFNSGQLSEILDIPVKSVHIAEQEELVQWIKENSGVALQLKGVDLHDADLHDVILSRADLSGSNLSSANLRGTNFHQAYLYEADLSLANLYEADLRMSNLERALLKMALLNKADMRKANLTGAILHDAHLSEVNLGGADLKRSDFRGAILREADLRKSNLNRAHLCTATLSEANLSEANLSEANLSEASLDDADMSQADLRGANLSDANLTNAIVTKTLFGQGLGLSEEDKNELRTRGAIFEDSPEDWAVNPTTVPSG